MNNNLNLERKSVQNVNQDYADVNWHLKSLNTLFHPRQDRHYIDYTGSKLSRTYRPGFKSRIMRVILFFTDFIYRFRPKHTKMPIIFQAARLKVEENIARSCRTLAEVDERVRLINQLIEELPKYHTVYCKKSWRLWKWTLGFIVRPYRRYLDRVRSAEYNALMNTLNQSIVPATIAKIKTEMMDKLNAERVAREAAERARREELERQEKARREALAEQERQRLAQIAAAEAVRKETVQQATAAALRTHEALAKLAEEPPIEPKPLSASTRAGSEMINDERNLKNHEGYFAIAFEQIKNAAKVKEIVRFLKDHQKPVKGIVIDFKNTEATHADLKELQQLCDLPNIPVVYLSNLQGQLPVPPPCREKEARADYFKLLAKIQCRQSVGVDILGLDLNGRENRYDHPESLAEADLLLKAFPFLHAHGRSPTLLSLPSIHEAPLMTFKFLPHFHQVTSLELTGYLEPFNLTEILKLPTLQNVSTLDLRRGLGLAGLKASDLAPFQQLRRVCRIYLPEERLCPASEISAIRRAFPQAQCYRQTDIDAAVNSFKSAMQAFNAALQNPPRPAEMKAAFSRVVQQYIALKAIDPEVAGQALAQQVTAPFNQFIYEHTVQIAHYLQQGKAISTIEGCPDAQQFGFILGESIPAALTIKKQHTLNGDVPEVSGMPRDYKGLFRVAIEDVEVAPAWFAKFGSAPGLIVDLKRSVPNEQQWTLLAAALQNCLRTIIFENVPDTLSLPTKGIANGEQRQKLFAALNHIQIQKPVKLLLDDPALTEAELTQVLRCVPTDQVILAAEITDQQLAKFAKVLAENQVWRVDLARCNQLTDHALNTLILYPQFTRVSLPAEIKPAAVAKARSSNPFAIKQIYVADPRPGKAEEALRAYSGPYEFAMPIILAMRNKRIDIDFYQQWENVTLDPDSVFYLLYEEDYKRLGQNQNVSAIRAEYLPMINPTNLIDFLAHFPKCTNLSLQGCENITDEAFKPGGQFEPGILQNITRLDLSFTGVTPGFVAEMRRVLGERVTIIYEQLPPAVEGQPDHQRNYIHYTRGVYTFREQDLIARLRDAIQKNQPRLIVFYRTCIEIFHSNLLIFLPELTKMPVQPIEKEFTDFTIKMEGRDIRINRSLWQNRSGYWAQQFGPGGQYHLVDEAELDETHEFEDAGAEQVKKFTAHQIELIDRFLRLGVLGQDERGITFDEALDLLPLAATLRMPTLEIECFKTLERQLSRTPSNKVIQALCNLQATAYNMSAFRQRCWDVLKLKVDSLPDGQLQTLVQNAQQMNGLLAARRNLSAEEQQLRRLMTEIKEHCETVITLRIQAQFAGDRAHPALTGDPDIDAAILASLRT